MPFYAYQCSGCLNIVRRFLKINDRDTPLVDPCGECGKDKIRLPEAPGFTDSFSLGRTKAPSEFRNLLKSIKKQNPGSNINER